MSVTERFEQLYRNFDKQAIDRLADVYSHDVRFIDPISEHCGFDAVQHYFSKLVANTQYCKCTIINKLVSDENVIVSWTMEFSHPSIRSGAMIQVDGISQLVIKDDKVIYHRDYYDMGQMIYEQLPLLGSLLRAIKKRMSA